MHNSLRRPARLLAVPTIALLALVAGAGSADARDYSDSDSDTTTSSTASSTASPTPSSAPRSAAPTSGTTPSGSLPGGSSSGPTQMPEGWVTAPGDVVTTDNGAISACNTACVAPLEELLNHMFDVLHPSGPNGSPATNSPQTST